jgi:Na+-driven multidrug efflux pump
MAEMFLMDLLDAINRVFLIECAGVDAMVLFSVPFRIVMFAVMLPNAFGMSLTPVASANLGAKKPENSVKAYRTCLKATGMISAAMIVIYMIFASILVVPFTMSESMIVMRPELGTLLRIECFMIPALSLSFVCGAMLQAMRKPMVAMVLTFTRTGLTTLFFALLMETSITYMCAGMVMANVIGGLLAFYTTRLKIRELGVVHHATA